MRLQGVHEAVHVFTKLYTLQALLITNSIDAAHTDRARTVAAIGSGH